MNVPEAVSVVIPTYNRAHLIDRALRSALPQLLPGDEIIVVDDGSTDQTEDIVQKYGAPVRYVKIPNGGAGRARNHGAALARNPLVAYLDSDDEWMSGSLYLRRSVMAALPDVLFAFSDFAVRDRDNIEYRRYLPNWHNDTRPWSAILGPARNFSGISELPAGHADFPVYTGNLYPSELSANYVFTSTLLVRKERAGEALRFAEDLPTHEDWLCFGLLSQAGLGAYLDCETAWQHGHAGPRLTGTDDVRAAGARIAVISRVWGKDAEFLQTHKVDFERVLAVHRLTKVKGLIKTGRTAEARAEMAMVRTAPRTYQLLAALPGPMVTAAIGAVQWLKSVARQ